MEGRIVGMGLGGGGGGMAGWMNRIERQWIVGVR